MLFRSAYLAQEQGKPKPLTAEQLRAFESYMNEIKIAGTILSIKSLPADQLRLKARITIDPQEITSKGLRISDGSRPLEEALQTYLLGITYGGSCNKTRLVDALQAVAGVIDVELLSLEAAPHNVELKLIEGNNYTAHAGCFQAIDLANTFDYVVSI